MQRSVVYGNAVRNVEHTQAYQQEQQQTKTNTIELLVSMQIVSQQHNKRRIEYQLWG
jgi:hypothetical protein